MTIVKANSASPSTLKSGISAVCARIYFNVNSYPVLQFGGTIHQTEKKKLSFCSLQLCY
jgi:hypothetical protein